MDISTTLRVRGLPWQATPQDIIEFFKGELCCHNREIKIMLDLRVHVASGCQVKDGEDGICMLLTEEGRPSGEALIEMETVEDFEKGLECDKNHMGSRYIEVFSAQPQDLDRAARKGNTFTANGSNGGFGGSDGGANESVYVRLRGLPYGCRRQQIEEFFEGLDIPQDGIILPTDHLGRSSGEAYVKFVSKEQADKALKKHKERIGHRYIEIFKSSPQEFRSISFNAGGGYHRSFEPPPPEQWYPPPYRGPMEAPRMRYNPRVAPYDRFAESPRGPYGMPRAPPPFRRGPEWEDYYFRDRPPMPRYDAPGPIYSRRRHVVHMRGIPFKASQGDVHEFFRPLQPINIRMLMDETGRSSGEADVEFGSHDEAVRAMNKDKANMQHRYIELFLESEPGPTPLPIPPPIQAPLHPPQPPPPPHQPMHAPMIPPPQPVFGGMRSYHSHVNNAPGSELHSFYGGAGVPRPTVASHDYLRHRM